MFTSWERGRGSCCIHSETSGSPVDGSFTRLCAPRINPLRRLCNPACGVLLLRMWRMGPLGIALVVF